MKNDEHEDEVVQVIVFRVPRTLRDATKIVAKRERVSMNAIFQRYIEAGLPAWAIEEAREEDHRGQ